MSGTGSGLTDEGYRIIMQVILFTILMNVIGKKI